MLLLVVDQNAQLQATATTKIHFSGLRRYLQSCSKDFCLSLWQELANDVIY
jgi:hypothetical protein